MRLVQRGKLKILDFDVECLPGHWIGGDYVSKIVTAVGWKWIVPRSRVHSLTHYDASPEVLTETLAQRIAEADLVVGHYIRAFDLPLLNGNLMRAGLEPLEPVFAQDTKLDLTKAHGRSLSQRNLAAMVGCRKPKVDVSLYEWEEFNLKVDGFRETGVARVEGDVLQNVEMRERLLELGWLGPPRVWDGRPRGGKGYRP